MELKLKRRELKVTLYDGSLLKMSYPTKFEHDIYIEQLLSDPSKEDEVTREFFLDHGMSEELFGSIEQPDLFEIGKILTGQKKT